MNYIKDIATVLEEDCDDNHPEFDLEKSLNFTFKLKKSLISIDFKNCNS